MHKKFVNVTLIALGLLAVPILFAGATQQDQKEDTKVYRATTLDGITVKSGTGENAENLGHVDDFVINLGTGKIVYYALAHGQTLGLGGKLFAISPEALRASPKGDFFVLEGVTNKDLDNGQGFNANDWPREPDMRWSKGKGKIEKKVEEGVKEVQKGIKGKDSLGRASSILGMAVRTPDNKNLGSVYDMAIRVKNGDHHVMYATVSHGGTLGIGGKLYAVPLAKLQMGSPKLNPNERVMILDITEDQLKSLKSFTSGDAWPADVDRNFWSKVKGGELNGGDENRPKDKD